MTMLSKHKVLMVTGVYYPEISGAVLQCRQLINLLKNNIDFRILSGTSSDLNSVENSVDKIPITRIAINPKCGFSQLASAFRIGQYFIFNCRYFDIVHLHGFSKKSILVIALSLLFRKKTIIKLTSFGEDDPISIKNRSALSWIFFMRANSFISVSPAFQKSYEAAGLPPDKYWFVPNGVDVLRFRPPVAGERESLRSELGFGVDEVILIFIGHFSQDKQPHILYDAWLELFKKGVKSRIIFIGSTSPSNYEVDVDLVEKIKKDATKSAYSSFVTFIERTHQIEKYLRLSDIFVLPTLREGLPNVLLEAMATGLPSIITNLPGVTDWIVEDSKTGVLLSPPSKDKLVHELEDLIADGAGRQEIGRAAREFIEHNFSAPTMASKVLQLYHNLSCQ